MFTSLYQIPFYLYTQYFLKYDFLYKYSLHNYYQIPKLIKLELILLTPHNKLKEILYSIFFLELLSTKKPFLIFQKKSSSNSFRLSYKAGTLIGCKLILRKQNLFNFYNFLIIELFPYISNFDTYFKILFKQKKKTNTLTFTIKDLQPLLQLEFFFLFFNHIKNLTIILTFNQKLSISQMLNLLYIPYTK